MFGFLRFAPLIARQVVRHRLRCVLTVGGIAVGMFLFVAVETLQRGVARATEVQSGETQLVVYRANRFCPFTSRLPQYYMDQIAAIEGVQNVVPVRVVVNNCKTSLDLVTFRGIPRERVAQEIWPRLRPLAGSLQAFEARGDAAIVGRVLAARRGLRVGESFDAAGVTVLVAAIVDSPEVHDLNTAYVGLDFLQNAVDRMGGMGQSSGESAAGGVVTQFNVRVSDAGQLAAVARRIDEAFARDPEPTMTSPEKAFVARAAKEVVMLVGFSRWIGLAALAAVLALVANAIVLSVQDRVREHAVLATLGYTPGLIARLVLAEGLLLSCAGGLIGALAAWAALELGGFSLSSEGLSIVFLAEWSLVGLGLLVSVAVGVLSGLVPAWQVARSDLIASLRA